MIILPARLASQRLKNKPLILINGIPLIVHVLRRAQQFNDVIVATCCDEIADVVEKNNGKAIITPADLPTGTDRVYYAAKKIKVKEDEIIINLQGDMPYFESELIEKTLKILDDSQFDIASAMHFLEKAKIDKSGNVKVACEFLNKTTAKALYFSRSPIPYKASSYYKHVGIYAYRFNALEKFVKTPITQLEKTEQLEQLRALFLGLRMGLTLINHHPVSVDVEEDLKIAEQFCC